MCIHGGATRGIAYLGAFDYLYSQGVRPVGFVARSAGCFAALGYSLNLGSKKVKNHFRKFDVQSLTSGINFPLIDQLKLTNFFVDIVPRKPLTKFYPPVYLAAANNSTRELEYLHHNITAIDAAIATCALPLAIGPVKVGEVNYIDGEIVGGNDVAFAKELFPGYKVLEIALNKGIFTRTLENTAIKLIDLMQGDVKSNYSINESADFYLNITGVFGGAFSTEHIDEHYQLGYDAAKEAWPEIRKMLV